MSEQSGKHPERTPSRRSRGRLAATVAGGLAHPKAIAVDEVCGTLYWATTGTTAVDGGGDGIAAGPALSISGCGDAGPLAFAPGASPVWVTFDANYVYWANYYDGTVWKRAK